MVVLKTRLKTLVWSLDVEDHRKRGRAVYPRMKENGHYVFA